MNAKGSVAVVAALSAGIAIGYFIPRSAQDAESPAVANAPAVAKKPIAENVKKPFADDAKDRRIAELEASNEKLAAEVERLNAKGDGQEVVQPVNGEEEQLVKEDEDGVTTTTVQRRSKIITDPDEVKKFSDALGKLMKSSQSEDTKDKNIEFLQDIDTDWMSDDELAIHNNLMDLIKRKAEADDAFRKRAFSLSDDNGHINISSLAERMSLDAELQSASRQERDMLLRRTADLIGYSDPDTFVSTVNDICDATTPNKGTTTTRTVMVNGKANAPMVFGGAFKPSSEDDNSSGPGGMVISTGFSVSE